MQTIPNKTNTQVSLYIIVIKMILCTFFWAGTFIAGKIATDYAHPAVIGFLRFAIAATILMAILIASGQFTLLTRKQFIGVTILALSGIVAYNLFFLLGLSLIPASRASLIIANNPLMIALGAAILFKEKLSLVQYGGIIISIIGAMTIISDGDILYLVTHISTGDLAIFACVVSWAIYSLVGKVVIGNLSPLASVTWASLIGAIIFLPLAIYQDLFADLATSSFQLWIATFYLGCFGTAIGFVWFYQAIKVLGAARSGVFINLVPVFGVLLGFLILDEKISLYMCLGGGLTMLGVYITNRR